jgi:hypothetical protein
MATILQFDFPFSGPWGTDAANALKDLADSIAVEPGLIWKAWTENEAEGIAGGIYYFADEPSALAYKEMHAARLGSFGITDIRAKVFSVNEDLSAITKFQNA